jgi:kinesin family member 22
MYLCSLYSAASTQSDVFENEVKPLICQVLKGYNATIFAYGATGSGKTHTVIGTENDPGIILRTVKGLLDSPSQFVARGSPAPSLEIQMSFLELYNNRAFDLLEPKGNEISIRDDHGSQTHCPDLARVTIVSNEQFSERFRLARNERITAPTRLNDQSSRSHAMLILYIQYSDGTNIFRCAPARRCLPFRNRSSPSPLRSGKLNIIDLAGNEDNRKSGNCGSRMVESCQINTSLFSLSNVCHPYRAPHIPCFLYDHFSFGSSSGLIPDAHPSHMLTGSPAIV